MNDIFSTHAPKQVLSGHECDATVISCIDFRFQHATLNDFVAGHLGIKTFDPITIPGGIKGLVENDAVVASYLRWALGVSVRLHKPRQLIIVHHSTCGAYGISDAEQEFFRHTQDLQAARKLLAQEFPSFQTIRPFMAIGRPDKNTIGYEEIN